MHAHEVGLKLGKFSLHIPSVSAPGVPLHLFFDKANIVLCIYCVMIEIDPSSFFQVPI